MIIDTHAHIDQDAFDEDRDAVVDRAREAGIKYMVNVGCDIESSYRSVELSEMYDFIFATAGVHPHDVKTIDNDTYLHLRDLLSHPRVIALGKQAWIISKLFATGSTAGTLPKTDRTCPGM